MSCRCRRCPPQLVQPRAPCSRPPGVPVRLAFLFETLEACGVFGHRTDLCLEHDVLRWCRTDDVREPPERGRAPMGPARGADIVSEHERFASTRGVFAIAEGLFTCPAEVTHGFGFHRGDLDRGEITRARQAGQ